jgi:hypothetical protein
MALLTSVGNGSAAEVAIDQIRPCDLAGILRNAWRAQNEKQAVTNGVFYNNRKDDEGADQSAESDKLLKPWLTAPPSEKAWEKSIVLQSRIFMRNHWMGVALAEERKVANEPERSAKRNHSALRKMKLSPVPRQADDDHDHDHDEDGGGGVAKRTRFGKMFSVLLYEDIATSSSSELSGNQSGQEENAAAEQGKKPAAEQEKKEEKRRAASAEAEKKKVEAAAAAAAAAEKKKKEEAAAALAAAAEKKKKADAAAERKRLVSVANAAAELAAEEEKKVAAAASAAASAATNDDEEEVCDDDDEGDMMTDEQFAESCKKILEDSRLRKAEAQRVVDDLKKASEKMMPQAGAAAPAPAPAPAAALLHYLPPVVVVPPPPPVVEEKLAAANNDAQAAAGGAKAAVVVEPAATLLPPPASKKVAVPPSPSPAETAKPAPAAAAAEEAEVTTSTKKTTKDTTTAAAKNTWVTDEDEFGTTRSLVMYSAEEQAWLTEAVTADIVTTIAFEAGFFDFTEKDAEFTEADINIIAGAVAAYFKKRVDGAWTETGDALMEHAVADNDIKMDAAIVQIIDHRVNFCTFDADECQPIYMYSERELRWLQQQVSGLVIEVIQDRLLNHRDDDDDDEKVAAAAYNNHQQAVVVVVAPLNVDEEAAIEHAVALYHEQRRMYKWTQKDKALIADVYDNFDFINDPNVKHLMEVRMLPVVPMMQEEEADLDGLFANAADADAFMSGGGGAVEDSMVVDSAEAAAPPLFSDVEEEVGEESAVDDDTEMGF